MKFTKFALPLALGAALFAPQAYAQEITLKASHNANAEEPYGVGMRKMAEILEEQTGGKATIEVYDNATLGDEMESIQGTQMGTVDIAVTANSTLANFVPDLSVFSLPFLFDGAEQMDRALSDPAVLAEIETALDAKGFHLLAVFSAGTRHIMTKKPINGLEDMAGLKIRTMQTPAHVDTFNAFGANATPIAYAELYGALETGVVDGAEAANTNFYAKKFYEVAPDWAVLGWLELVAPVVMGKAAYEALPDDVKVALDQAGLEAGKAERAAYLASDNARFADLEAVGVTITHPDAAPFREAAAAVQQKYLETDTQKAIFDLLKAVE
ncbi:tripartite ATP-independent transporter DctP family solute receptor [Rhodobacter aestuarii]|uniref:Tripartite ATP-independent transporter solute receptor, DctP family n=1 Tax=Rhodobacter aestuarii TaxID=453582 RepID=A0A1N7K0Q1_9RHOB|nr:MULTISPECIES: TRAP transporter substrate-binding protein [Rhodobacter]PTV95907.1 tripartite ATP-independent transporter DctP family solute receptor [Rhodobacter aestuarii]SIS55162.1 tripartite ATP-independent transporter solute receptor, DctP family [Rhodobacter aestuarii]SOC10939.1 tripartite ATP-independent transporter DctP family solute receptor [Rhodobacter sp. JA431]